MGRGPTPNTANTTPARAALVIALAPRRLASAALCGSRAGRTRRGDQAQP
jgi:hypothetical protein